MVINHICVGIITVNGESFTGLNFRGIPIIWILWLYFCGTRPRHLFLILRAKDLWKNFRGPKKP